MNISIIAAMNIEAKYIIKTLNLIQQDFKPKTKFYTGKLNKIILSLIVPEQENCIEKIGYIPSSINTMEIIYNFNPDLILSIGTAGGIKEKDCEIADIFLSTGNIFYHDRFLPELYKDYSYGGFPCCHIEKYNNLKNGVVSSSASTVISKESWDILKFKDVSIVDMEAAAVAEVCYFYEKKMSAIKVVTDIVDLPGACESQFIKNFKPCMEKLSSALPEILTHMATDILKMN